MASASAERPRRPRPRRRISRKDADAVLDLLEALPRVVAAHDGPYTFTDRARDFIATFNTDQGRRVLSQIHQICDPPPAFADADRHGTLAMKSGMRRVFAEIMRCMVAQPPIRIEDGPS